MRADPQARWLLAVAVRSRDAAVVIMSPGDIIYVRRRSSRHKPNGETWPHYLARGVRDLGVSYRIEHVIIEPNNATKRMLEELVPTVTTIPVIEAKCMILQGRLDQRHHVLYDEVVRQHPKLRRFMTSLVCGGIAKTERRDTVILLAAALGIAAQEVNKRSITQ